MTRKIDMEKLKAVSPRMIEMIGLMNAREYDYHVPKELWPLWDAIAATMLKLAEENEAARKNLGWIANGRFADPVAAARNFFMPKMEVKKERTP